MKIKMSKKIDCDGVDKVICPYCGKEIPIDQDDGMDFEGEKIYSYCSYCEKEFEYNYTTSITYYTESYKIEDEEK
jgi:uncharacterized Zn-finger protein